MEKTQQKSVKKWVLLLVMPIVALIFVAFAQSIARFVSSSSTPVTETSLETQDSDETFGALINSRSTPETKTNKETQSSNQTIETVINIFSLLIGVVSVIALLLTPLWLVMLVRELKGHVRSKPVAVVLAVFFGFLSWIYTWEKNNNKFWICLAITAITLGYGSIICWLWAIIDNASKPDEFYSNYNQTLPAATPQAQTDQP